MPKIVDPQIELTEICPQISAEDAAHVEENLRRYLRLVRFIYDHIQLTNPRILTELRRRARLRKQKAHR